MKSYHFDFGNSNTGAVGMCARVRAKTQDQALEILKRVLPEEVEIKRYCEDTDEVEYVNIYLGPQNITTDDIDEEEEVDEEEEKQP